MNILLVDDEDGCIEILECYIKSLFPFNIAIHVASGGHNAIEILKKSKIDLCICDHNMPNGMGNIVLKYIIDENQKTKFVLCSTILPAHFPDLYPPQNIFYNIQKPDVHTGIKTLYKLTMKDRAVENNNDDFTPLTPSFLLLLGVTPADIYIKISSNKFVKCLNKNTSFDTSDFEKYQQKSLTKLFILKDDDKKNVDLNIFRAISGLMNNSKLSVDTRLSIAHAQLSEMIKSHGMTPELKEFTKDNIKKSVSVIMKTDLLDNFWREVSPLGEYPSDIYSLHSLLASAVVKKLKWNTETSIFKLTMAAFLQDATLNSTSLSKVYNYRHYLEVEKNLSIKEVKTFMNRPQAIKEMISVFKGLPKDIERILQEQHEMPDGTGFPQRLNARKIDPLTCVFILTGILARCILKDGSTFQFENFLKEFEAEGYNRGNFKESFSVLRNMQV